MKKIEGSIRMRIVKQLRFMSLRWPGRKEIWKMRLDFTKSVNFYSEVSINLS